jgi:cysteine desulfurase / selenocysteine lyase
MASRTAPYDVEALRAEEFPWTRETIYLNAASIGPLPERSRRAIDDFTRRRTMPHLLPDRVLQATLAEGRRLAARLIAADASEIALTTNTTTGINVAAGALPLAAGDVVLVSDREFPANVYPWLRLREKGVRVELAPATPEGWPDEAHLLERIRAPEVKLLAVSLVQFANGYLVDLDRISSEARASGTWLVVDAIQGLGQIPIDVLRTPVDVLACGAQKWLLSPWGSGFVYVRKELVRQLVPQQVGWMAFEGTDDFARLTAYDDRLREDARRFEVVTLPFQDVAGMSASLGLLLEVGIERIREHLRHVAEPVLDWAARRGIRLASPVGEHASGIVCVAPPDVAARHAALKRAGVVSSLREGSIRLSPHLYNTVEELARVAELLDAGL